MSIAMADVTSVPKTKDSDPNVWTAAFPPGFQAELVKNSTPLAIIAGQDCHNKTVASKRNKKTTQAAAAAQIPLNTRSPRLGILNDPTAGRFGAEEESRFSVGVAIT